MQVEQVLCRWCSELKLEVNIINFLLKAASCTTLSNTFPSSLRCKPSSLCLCPNLKSKQYNCKVTTLSKKCLHSFSRERFTAVVQIICKTLFCPTEQGPRLLTCAYIRCLYIHTPHTIRINYSPLKNNMNKSTHHASHEYLKYIISVVPPISPFCSPSLQTVQHPHAFFPSSITNAPIYPSIHPFFLRSACCMGLFVLVSPSHCRWLLKLQ